MPRYAKSTVEFTTLMASLMSMVALTIDAVLPALGEVGQHFQVSDVNQTQWVIYCVFAGMMLGQLFFGPLSDAIGRKKVLFIGVILYVVGTLFSYFAAHFESFLLGRVIQGLGVAAPYVASVSVVRDRFSGEQMAKTMSLIMMVFMVVPAIAPSVGQVVIHFFSWQAIFILYLLYALLVAVWMGLRLEETLPDSRRRPLRFAVFKMGFSEIFHNRTTMSYLICVGLCFGAFMSYLSTSQQIFMQQFHKSGVEFSLYFALLAAVSGSAAFTNSQIVERIGMRKICLVGTLSMSLISLCFVGVQLLGVVVEFGLFMGYAVILFFLQGLVFGNLNSIAMQPMGHIAGLASAIIGASSSILSISLGALIGQMYDGTLIPLASGFAVLCGLAFILVLLESRSRHFVVK